MATSTIKRNKPRGFGTAVVLDGYTSASNVYTVPTDGMVTISSNYPSQNYITLNVNSANVASCNGGGKTDETSSFPVYAGDRVYLVYNVGTGNTARFRPYTY